MDSKILFIVGILVVLVLVAIFYGIITIYSKSQNFEELSTDSGSWRYYKGPAGEPLWNGRLPTRFSDYKEPRYVYENLEESTDYLPENGRIIGYRISPELVIHSRVKDSMNAGDFRRYVERFGGKLLNLEDVMLLLKNWEQISLLRQKAGDSPLVCNKLMLGTQDRDLVAFHLECFSSPDTHIRLCGFYLNPSHYTKVSLILKR